MLKSIYKTGSSLLLKNNRDTDYVHFYETEVEMIKAINARIKEHHKHDKENDVHFDFVRELKPFRYAYLWHFMELVEGEDLHLKDFDMFEEQNKKEYLEILKEWAQKLKPKGKQWYHILLVLYMFDNGKYELTDEQKENIQKVHDEGITDNLKKYCLERLDLVI